MTVTDSAGGQYNSEAFYLQVEIGADGRAVAKYSRSEEAPTDGMIFSGEISGEDVALKLANPSGEADVGTLSLHRRGDEIMVKLHAIYHGQTFDYSDFATR